MRQVKVGLQTYFLEQNPIDSGIKLDESLSFSISAMFNGSTPMSYRRLFRGLSIVSTLPNILKESCIKQIVDLETMLCVLPVKPTVYHVSSDTEENWRSGSRKLANVKSSGFSINGSYCDAESILTFKRVFGIGVVGTDRLAHGLFSIYHGSVLSAQVPDDQLGVPNIPLFLNETCDGIKAFCQSCH